MLGTLAAGCAPRLVVLRPDSVLPASGPAGPDTLEVLGSASGGADPLPVPGGTVAFAGLAPAAAQFVAFETRRWADRRRVEGIGGWQLRVELTRSRAEEHGGRLTVELDARITLRATTGQVHVAQTHGYCKATDLVTGEDGSRLVYQCLGRMAHDVAGWLEGLAPA